MIDAADNTFGGALHFFMCADASSGFVSLAEGVIRKENDRVFAISGGPGVGKSSMIKKSLESFAELCNNVEVVHCAKDPHSLDAAFFHDKNFALVDSTPPHTINPKYPGICESSVDLTASLDEAVLSKSSDEIKSLFDEECECRERCSRYLGAAASTLAEIHDIALQFVKAKKLEGFCQRLTQKLFPKLDEEGSDTPRFLSAVTGEGVVFLDQYVKSAGYKIFVIEDDCEAASRLILLKLRSLILKNGHSTISCYCPISSFKRLEHLLIPSEKIAFLTVKKGHSISVTPDKTIHTKRFYDLEALAKKRGRLSLSRKISAYLIEKASLQLADAYKAHMQLEAIYGAATDYSVVDCRTEELIEKISKYFE